MTRLLLVVSLALLVASSCTKPPPAPEPTAEAPATPEPTKKKREALKDGRDDYEERALEWAEVEAMAQSEGVKNRRVMLMFGGDWCVWCHALNKLFDEDAEVKAALEAGYRLVKVDIETNEALDEKLGKPSKNGFPVLVILDDDAKVLHTQETGSLETGKKGEVAHDPARVLAFLKKFSRAE